MKIPSPKISILDCTLRDGSYSIDYQFTAEDTYLVVLGLARAGFEFIEVGHGTGLGSAAAGKGQAAALDEEYLASARAGVDGSRARCGMFFIPGIGTMEDIEKAAAMGMDFVRIGTNVTEVETARPYIERARALGMMVFSNLMKSYALTPEAFAQQARLADAYGADVIVVVDSAGGMLPHNVADYVGRLRDVTAKAVGFHGHNNLQLAIANSLEAVKSGATFVDSSLQGMGRSAGNAQTEVLVMTLEKLGYSTGIDAYKAMDLGERIIKPVMGKSQGVDDISLVSGIAQFHSSFTQIVDDAAKKYHVDPRQLILEVSEIDRINISPELAEEMALRLSQKKGQGPSDRADLDINTTVSRKKTCETIQDHVRLLLQEIISQTRKSGKAAVFSLTLNEQGQDAFPFIRQSPAYVIGNAELADPRILRDLLRQMDGVVQWIALDESCPYLRASGLAAEVRKSGLVWYSERRIQHLAVQALLSSRETRGKILVLAAPTDFDLMRTSLGQEGMNVVALRELTREKDLAALGAIVSFGPEFAGEMSLLDVSCLNDGCGIYSVRPGAFPVDFRNAAVVRGLFVCRVDSRAALAAELSLMIETRKLVNAMGSSHVADVPVVASGVIGQKGTVVLDSLAHPTKVIGVADGQGGLLKDQDEQPFLAAKEKVNAELIRNLYREGY